mgnify:CR=1 FL=1
MEQEWLEIAYINFDKAIMHGRVTVGRDNLGCIKEREVEQVLTDEQKRAVEDLEIKHRSELRRLLKSFVDGQPA